MTPFIHYTLLFECHADYFECHEVLEEAWQADGRRHHGYAALIQYAVIHYHLRRDNLIGAKKSLRLLRRKMDIASPYLNELGLDVDSFIAQLDEWPLATNLPLQQHVRDTVESLKPTFPSTDLSFEQLVHKHLHRDRSEVITERELSLLERQRTRNSASPS
jgi:predicted metal-dependent hydrolase